LTDEEITAAIDGTLEGDDLGRVREHLVACKECRILVGDSALYLGLWETGGEGFETDAALIDEGKAVAEPGDVMPASPGRGVADAARRRFIAVGAAAACVIIAAAVLWIGIGRRAERRALDPSLVGPIRRAVGSVSRRGTLVIPGGEFALRGGDDTFRSGYSIFSDTLKTALHSLYKDYVEGEARPEAAEWLIAGNIAAGQRETARDILNDARRRFPARQPLIVLEAIVSYMEGDLDGAEAAMRRAVEADPADPIARLDLAVVLIERGRISDAVPILDGLAKQHAGEPISLRADSLLAVIRSD
jgi:hypothetical protein